MSHNETREERRGGLGWIAGRKRQRQRGEMRPTLLMLEERTLLSLFTVTSAADSNSVSPYTTGTLRWAVEQADAANSASSIEIELGTSPAAITLAQGQLTLSNANDGTTIYDGPGEGPVTISGNNASRVFQVDSGVTASISGLTITDGNAGTGYGYHNGGGLYNLGTTTLTDCSVSGNSAAGGGGIDNGRGAAITLTNCAISGNSAIGRVSGGYFYGGSGGGILASYYSQATLINCIITNNTAPGGSGGALSFNGSTDSPTNTLVGCTFSGNSATSGDGGALFANDSKLSLTNCTFSANSAGVGGGAFLNQSATDTLTNCAISGNTATGRGLYDQSGGGLYLGSGATNTTLMNCTVSGNSAFADGGGIAAQGQNNTTLIDCTIFGNSAGQSGGGVSNEGLVAEVITDCTISGNFADQSGGGVTSIIHGSNICEPTISNTILAGNAALVSGPDSNITFVSGGNNLIGNTSGSSGWVSSDLTGINPLLAPLGNYGGPTETLALLPGSPALGAGNNSLIPAGDTTDQRGTGFPRVVNGTVDIGAFESSGFSIAVTSGSGQSASGAFSAPLVATVTANNPIEPVAGGLVTFITPPLTGASATISASPAVISASGTASVTAASNFIGGSYTVLATAAGAPGAASFSLTNFAVVSIAVSPGNPSLAVGVSAQFTALGTFTDGLTQNITNAVAWTSATPSSATIGSTGVATGVAVGASNITASLPGVTRSPSATPLTSVTSPADTLSVIAPSFVVTTTNDAFGFYSGTTSLREAIAGSNVVPGGHTITFDNTVFKSPQTINLTLGQLELSDTTGTEAITGPAAGVTVDAGGNSRVFQIDPSVTASISGLTITDGNAGTGYGYHNGGGLYNLGTTTLTDCSISGNSAESGGGLENGDGATITLTNCTISGNSASGSGSSGRRRRGGGGAGGSGGGILGVDYSQATLINCIITNNTATGANGGALAFSGGSSSPTNTLVGCTLSGNSATSGDGGALFANDSDLSLTNCTFSANSAGLGGAAFLTQSESDTLTNCTISGNTATGQGQYDQSGGGLYLGVGNNTTLMNCTVSGNSALANGGGIAAEGAGFGNNTTLIDCTIFGNSAGQSGGGVSNEGLVGEVITNCTISGNSADQSGGGVTSFIRGSIISQPTISNTILAGNTALVSGPDGNITFVSEGNNLIGNTSGSSGWGSSDLTGIDPLLAPLGNYGGPTETLALLPGSPALGAGNNSLIPAGDTTDQRGTGFPRVVNGTVDIGAFESSGFSIAVTSGSGQSTPMNTTFSDPLVVTVTAHNPDEPVAGGRVTFTSPGSGASATPSNNPATIGSAGTASITATANNIGGSYAVTATASGITTPASFSLTNNTNNNTNIVLAVTKTADSSSVTVGTNGAPVGYTVTISNTNPVAATGVTLNDPLPPGAYGDINWTIDTSKGNPSDFAISGSVGSQTLTLASGFNTLAANTSIFVHYTGKATANDTNTSTNPALNVGGIASYDVLYEGTGNNQLSITNDTIDGNIGVGGGQVQFNGPGKIGGRLDFSAANSGQYHNTNKSNGGPAAVNYNVSAVTTAINAVNSLSTSLGGLSGTSISFNNSNQTINESSGTLQTSNGVSYRVFNVTSYSENNNDTVTINGDGSGDPVVFNFAYSSNTNLGGQVTLTGGLTDDQVMWNFTSSGKSVQLTNNGGTYVGVIIVPNDSFNSNNFNLNGRVYGGAAGNMQLTGGANVYAPATTGTLTNTATVSAIGDPTSARATATITIKNGGVANALTLDAPSGTAAYTPAQIRAAYGISNLALDGTGQTIAIVDAYDDPSIFQSLNAFDNQFGLTSSGSTLYQQYGPASSFLTVLNQSGQATSLPGTDPSGAGTDDWEVEEALDVEWAHAIAPGAQIILVEANSQSLSDLMASVATAASQRGVSVVSMSWGFAEGQAVFASNEAAYDSYFNVPGVTFVASTGDYGAADPEYPAYSPNVVAVGGTSLTLNGDGSYNSETGWGYQSSSVGAFIGSGGGISLYEPEPAYQQGVQSTGSRTTPDVSLVADPATGAWIADTYNLDSSNPFEVVGGTSLSAPAWAGLLALVDQGSAAAGGSTLNSLSPTEAQQALYSLPQNDYNVISGGTNGYAVEAGYNLVTGLGTPVANLLVSDLVAYQSGTFVASSPTVGPLQSANLVNTGTAGGGTEDVFNVFDSVIDTGNGLGSAGDKTRVLSVIKAPQQHPHVIPATAISAPTSSSTGLMALDLVLADAGTGSASVQTAGKRSTVNVVTTAPKPTAIDPAAVDALLFERLSVRIRGTAARPRQSFKWSI